ncbi:hypothetical protein ACFLU1_06915 [Chloroflexota bacterium]
MNKQEFKHELDELMRLIGDGVGYFTAWRCLMVEDDVSAHALNRYRGLFLPARNSMQWSTLLQITKIFDRDRRTVSLWNLLAAAQNNPMELVPYTTLDELENIKTKMNDNKKVLTRLIRFRNKRLAHHDASINGDTKVLYGEVKILIEDIQSIFNVLSLGHERAHTTFGAIIRDSEFHTSEVVRIMKEQRERDLQIIRRADEAIEENNG